MTLLTVVLSGFVLALFVSPLNRVARRATGWLLALLPLGIVAYLINQMPQIAEGEPVRYTLEWVPSLGVNLSFYLDGLSLLLALIISGIGALVLIYGQGYLQGDEGIGRFFSYLLIFMAAMLGVVLSDNLFTLFMFWEITSISSYLLIGYKFRYQTSRRSALQALLVTGGGGLAMFAGFIVLYLATGSAEISVIRDSNLFVTSGTVYAIVVILVLLGAFTKSAQFPFHFWLPNAMVAPTPVSTYLHSATMVKAGIYLMARMTPILGGTTSWMATLVIFGGVTMLLGAFLGWQQHDLKRVLAYSTLSVLGTLTLLIGVGSPLAIQAALVFLLAHALYKGALFMVAGAIDHETGTRDLRQLGGLIGVMPVTFFAAIIAALSMAGLAPLIGFIAKELEYEALLDGGQPWLYVLIVATVLANALVGVAAGLVVIKPFFGRKQSLPNEPHEAPIAMWLGPILLAILGAVFGIMPWLIDETLIAPAAAAVAQVTEFEHLALWHGFKWPLGLSVLTIGLAVGIYLLRDRMLPSAERISIGRYGPTHLYQMALPAFTNLADRITRLLQNGNLRYYLNIIIGTAVVLIGSAYLIDAWPNIAINTDISDIPILALLLAFMIVVSSIASTILKSRLAAIIMLGVIGYCVAILFLLFGAPDLAMTQFSVETLTVVVIVLVIWKLPQFEHLTERGDRIKDIIIAVAVGALMMLFVLVVTAEPFTSDIAPYFVENSYVLAKGRNVVNVILVDFRGFDTLGEITVLAIAGLGVFVLSRLRSEKRQRPDDDG